MFKILVIDGFEFAKTVRRLNENIPILFMTARDDFAAKQRGYNYPGMLIYGMALYTFYATVHAIIDIVRCRKLGSPVLSTAKIVSLSAALVSMLNLETAMFAQFGADMPKAHQQLFIILTGAGVSITVVTLSLILIVKATKEIRRQKHGK